MRHLLAVVEEVVGQVVAYVPKDATAIDGYRRIPVVKEDGMRKLPKRKGKHYE